MSRQKSSAPACQVYRRSEDRSARRPGESAPLPAVREYRLGGAHRPEERLALEQEERFLVEELVKARMGVRTRYNYDQKRQDKLTARLETVKVLLGTFHVRGQHPPKPTETLAMIRVAQNHANKGPVDMGVYGGFRSDVVGGIKDATGQGKATVLRFRRKGAAQKMRDDQAREAIRPIAQLMLRAITG